MSNYRKNRSTGTFDDLDLANIPMFDDDVEAHQRKIRDKLEIAIADLSETQRKYIEMYYYKKMDMQTIAKTCGVCPSSVCRTLERARNNIKKVLKYSF